MSKIRPRAWVQPEAPRGIEVSGKSFWNALLDQIIKDVVGEDLRGKNHEHLDAEEHLELVFIKQEIDRRCALRVSSVEIENDFLAFTPHRALDLVRAKALAVIAHIVFEADWFFANSLRQ